MYLLQPYWPSSNKFCSNYPRERKILLKTSKTSLFSRKRASVTKGWSLKGQIWQKTKTSFPFPLGYPRKWPYCPHYPSLSSFPTHSVKYFPPATGDRATDFAESLTFSSKKPTTHAAAGLFPQKSESELCVWKERKKKNPAHIAYLDKYFISSFLHASLAFDPRTRHTWRIQKKGSCSLFQPCSV